MDKSHLYVRNIHGVKNSDGESVEMTWITVRGEGQTLPGGTMYVGQVAWREPDKTFSPEWKKKMNSLRIEPYWKPRHGTMPAIGWYWDDGRHDESARHLRQIVSHALRVSEAGRVRMEKEENWQSPTWSDLPVLHFSLPVIHAAGENREFIVAFSFDEVRKHLIELGYTL